MTTATAEPTAAATSNPFEHAPGADLIGEIITWDVEATEVTADDLRLALSDAGLDPKLVKPIAYSDAFRRAMRRLASKTTIVRCVDDTADQIRYQITREFKDDGSDGLEYARECQVALTKADGSLACPDPATLDRARHETDRQYNYRTGQDVSRGIFRLFDDARRADLDLIPLRERGGVYFVRRERAGFVDQVDRFLAALNRRLNRFPIAKSRDNRSVREAVADKMRSLISEYEEAVEAFGEDTRERTLEAAAQRVQTLRVKVESYAAYLEHEQAGLLASVERAKDRLRAKVSEIGVARAARS